MLKGSTILICAKLTLQLLLLFIPVRYVEKNQRAYYEQAASLQPRALYAFPYHLSNYIVICSHNHLMAH